MSTITPAISLAESYAADTLGIEWPAGLPLHIVGRRLILRVTKQRGWYYKPPTVYTGLDGVPGHRGHGMHIGWRRLPTDVERDTCPAVHVFDRQSAYLSVCSSVDLPIGDPQWVPSAECVKKPGTGWTVGLWHVTVGHYDSPWNGRELPAVCPEGDVWLWTPVLRAAQECGYQVKPASGAVLWLDETGQRAQTRVLESWQKHVWSARRALETDAGGSYPDDDARRAAVKIIKGIYTKTIGWLGHMPRIAELTAEEVAAGATPNDEWRRWYRPEWQRLIHAEAVSRAFYAARKAVERGHAPLWMYVDCLALAGAESPDGLADAAGLFVKPESCGAWAHEYSVPMSVACERHVPRGIVTVGDKGHRLPTVK